MQKPKDLSSAATSRSSAGAADSQASQDPMQEAVETPDGVEFLHAGSGNTLGDGRTAGGSSNVAARDALPDTDAKNDGDAA
jgi:hypothetical protein